MDERTTSRPGARSTLALAVASAVANVLGYIFTIAMSRLLGVRDFGELGTQLAVWLVALIPAMACQLTAAKAVASGPTQHAAAAPGPALPGPALPGAAAGERGAAVGGVAAVNGAGSVSGAAGDTEVATVSTMVRLGALLGAAEAGVLALAAVPLAAALHVGVPAMLWLAAGQLPLTVLFAVLGIFQGRSEFGRFGVLMAGFQGIRLVAGVSVAAAGFGPSAVWASTALAALVAGAAACRLAGLPVRRRELRPDQVQAGGAGGLQWASPPAGSAGPRWAAPQVHRTQGLASSAEGAAEGRPLGSSAGGAEVPLPNRVAGAVEGRLLDWSAGGAEVPLANRVAGAAGLRWASPLADAAAGPSANGVAGAAGLRWASPPAVASGMQSASQPAGGAEVLARPWAVLARGTASMGGLLLLTTVDLLLAGHFLTADARGVYASGNVLTRIAFWGPQFIGTLAYPGLVRPDHRARARRLALLAVGGLALVGLLLALVAGPLLVDLLFGPEYRSLAPLVPLFVLLGASAAVLNVVLLDDVATGRSVATRLAFTAVAVEAVAVTLWWHSSPGQVVATAATVSSVAALLAVARTAGGVARQPRSRAARSGRPISVSRSTAR